MTKELYISSSVHETKVAVLEDDQLVEVFFERDTGQGLVGNIYKGRVSRVLPGMQSAFVDIGLERDAFLYVSDFFEDSEEYDKVVSEAEAKVSRYGQAQSQDQPPTPPSAEPAQGTVSPVSAIAEAAPLEAPAIVPSAAVAGPENLVAPATSSPPSGERRSDFASRDHRGRRRRRGRGFREEGFGGRPGRPPRFDRSERPERPDKAETANSRDYAEPHDFEILPGESLAKHAQTGSPSNSAPTENSIPEATLDESSVETADLKPSSAPGETGQARPAAETPDSNQQTRVEREPKAEAVVEESSPSRPAIAGPPIKFAQNVESAQASLTGSTETMVAATEKTEMPAAAAPPPAPTSAETGEFATTEEPEPGVAGEGAAVSLSEERVTAAEDAGTEEEEAEGEGADAEALVEAEGEVPETAEIEAAPAAGETPGAASEMSAGERSYTLRDSQQHRPRFAPRRRRGGRRGFGGELRRQEASRPGNNQPVQISELLREGQEILVQVAKEPLGTKGARITSHIALPGRYLVYMPTIHHIGVSRKISSEEERLRLRSIILENRGSLTGGFIVRTAGQGRSEEELKADLKFLSTLWNEIRAKAERSRAPALLHRDLDLVQRILRDTLSPDFKTIRADSEAEYERVVEFVNRCQPALVGHVKLYDRETPLFEEFGVQAEIDKALKPKVWLKSGGFIVINQTEALVAIDVNTGKYVGRTNRLEDTIVKTNIDAVKEIVRQIRLRDLGGIIVIDFIDMDERRNRQKVVQALEEALRHDRAPTNILSINEFGLVALTRKRVKQSLERTLCEPCHYCTGAGWIKSATTVCYEILEEARKMAQHIEGKSMTLRVNPEIAQALKSRDSLLLSELEALTRKDVIIKSDPTVHQERFEIF